jgi:hypothetical protein
MEKKLKEILDNYEERIVRYEGKTEKLIAKIEFCKEHGFSEEGRIARIEYEAIYMLVHHWRTMHNEITEVLNAWNS